MRALLRDTWKPFSRQGGRLLAAGIAFYSLLSMIPIFVIALRVAGLVTGEQRAKQELVKELSRWIGDGGASTVEALIVRVEQDVDTREKLLGALLLVYASTRLFSSLRRAINQIWGVPTESPAGFVKKVTHQLFRRALAFLLVLATSVLLVALVVTNTALAALATHLDLAAGGVGWHALTWAGSLFVTTLLFTVLYSVLPDARVHRRDALFGAFATALLFSIGTQLVGLYVGHKAVEPRFGAAGPVIMLVLWTYYSGQVFLLGASFTAAYARLRGRGVEPRSPAV